MKAAYYESYGAAADVLRFGDLLDPTPAAGEVRVRMRWSGVNPSDVNTRSGMRASAPPFPTVVPHSDGMGIIDAVGGGVDPARIGQRVWIWNAAWNRAFGTAAEYLTVPHQQAVYLPDNVPDEAGACLGIPALTALHAITCDGGCAGKVVLVAGGAGAVGHYAVQFAKHLGAAKVISTVSTAEKATLAASAGADLTINYRDSDWVQRVRDETAGVGVDRIVEVDVAANGAADVSALAYGGRIVSYGSGKPEFQLPFRQLVMTNASARFFIVYLLAPDVRSALTTTLHQLLELPSLAHNVAVRLPLQDIARAHELVEKHVPVGNVVLEIP